MPKDRNYLDVNTGLLPTEDEIYAQNDKGINITGSATNIIPVTVTSYAVATNTGAGNDSTGTGVTFTNATGSYLTPGDVVAVAIQSTGNIAVAIISRAGALTPGEVPPITLDTNFPLVTSTLTYPIAPYTNNTERPYLAYDSTGLFGLGTDVLIGISSAATSTQALNGVNTLSPAVYSFGTIGESSTISYRLYLNYTGTLFYLIRTGSSGNDFKLYYKNTYSDTWHLVSNTTTASNTLVYDYVTGSLWFKSDTVLKKWLSGDTVESTVTTSKSDIVLIAAGNSYLIGTSGGKVWRKSSIDDSDWVEIYSGSITGLTYAVGPLGELYSILETSSTVRINRYYNGLLTQYNTGLDSTGALTPLDMEVGSNGIIYFLMLATADQIVIAGAPIGSASQWNIALCGASFNSSTSWLYADVNSNQSTNIAYSFGNSLQQLPYGKMLFGAGYGGGALSPAFLAYKHSI